MSVKDAVMILVKHACSECSTFLMKIRMVLSQYLNLKEGPLVGEGGIRVGGGLMFCKFETDRC